MDFYIILGLDRDATVADVKKAYRRLARRFHPDVNPGDQRSAVRFREIAEAYAILSDPDRRRRYDQVGYEPVAAEGAATGFEGFDFSAAVHANQQSTFGDLFADVFRGEPLHVAGARARRRPARDGQPDVRAGDARRRVPRRGPEAGDLQGLCGDRCAVDGGGQVSGVRRRRHRALGPRAHGLHPALRPVPGHGQCWCSRRAPAAAGSGSVARSEHCDGDVPAGIHDGVRLRVGGRRQCAGGWEALPATSTSPCTSRRIRCSGETETSLHLVVPVAVHEAALGARIEIPGIDGPTRLRVPPGTQSGQHFRLRGRGAPSPRTAGAAIWSWRSGLMLPSVLDERSKLLLRELGMLNGESVRRDFDKAWRPPTAESREAWNRETRELENSSSSGSAYSRFSSFLTSRAGEQAMATKRSGKAYYMISAVAAKYDIHPQTLRLYEREGLLKPSQNRRQHAPLFRGRPRSARNHPVADARARRQPRRRRGHPEHAPQDGAHAAGSERVHGLREEGAGARARRLGAAPQHRHGQVVAD